MTRKILITGATGKVGAAVIPHLAADTDIEVIAAARSPAKAAHLGVPVVHLDFDQVETLVPALHGIDSVFMLTGYTVDMFRQSKDFINAAKRAGVRRIVHLGACGDDDTDVAHWVGSSSSSGTSSGRGLRSRICAPTSTCRTCWATVAPAPCATA
jgi:NAD(P)H dehydrogenase (quinone)